MNPFAQVYRLFCEWRIRVAYARLPYVQQRKEWL